MTWHAPEGELTLHGKEAAIFREAILEMCDYILDEDGDEGTVFGGARVFDRMTRSQQLASLEKVAKHLFHATDECLELSAWSEATLASILKQIQINIHLEIDGGEGEEIRRFLDRHLDYDIDPAKWDEHQEWDLNMDAYESRFLWDADFQNDTMSDMSPDRAEHLRKMFGIDDDYFLSVPPDLEAEWDIPRAAKRIWMIIDGKKTVQMTVTLTADVPASLVVGKSEEFGQIIRRCYPSMILMRDLGNGSAEEVDDELFDFFSSDGVFDHHIKEVMPEQKDDEQNT